MIRLLSIEDSDTTRELLGRIFSKLAPDIHVEFAIDLSEGLRKVKNGRYDVVLLDLILPDAPRDHCTSTTQVALASGVPVVILSGISQPDADEAAEKCLCAGASEYFQKQLINTDADLLVRVIRKVVFAHQGRQYLAEKNRY